MIWTSLFFLFFGGAFGFFAGVFCAERKFQNDWMDRFQECVALRKELMTELERVGREKERYENRNEAD